jgi:hypothetical protein
MEDLPGDFKTEHGLYVVDEWSVMFLLVFFISDSLGNWWRWKCIMTARWILASEQVVAAEVD